MSWVPWLVGWLWFAPSPPVCRVRVVGMPLPQLRHHELRTAGRVLPATGLVELPEDAREVVLTGPRYSGSVTPPAQCKATVVLNATPRPATVEFRDLPPEAVVSCVDCPGIDPDANYLPAHLPSMVMDRLRTSVSLWVRAPGFHSVESTVVLYPGKNIVRISMQRRSALH
ncbi:MAG: hypothetical protein ACRBN8_20720 [Nannocystales bacterium]